MNTTDLREELAARTDGLHAESASIAAGVTGRVRATKRRRAAGAAGGLGAAALALGLVLANTGPAITPAPVPAATGRGVEHRATAGPGRRHRRAAQ